MKLIDKDTVVAWAKETYLCDNASMIRKVCYKQLLNFLDTLEVKEVDIDIDIEKEVMDWWNTYYSSKDYTFERYTGHYLENSTLIKIVKHFFELGLKTQEGKQNV